ncbi:head GIN domain-containing protein, partial [Umezakia ovalisporum]
AVVLISCERADVGPEQPDRRTYGLKGFDALQMGSAFRVDVRQGSAFAITASGDRRNLDDLDVWVSQGTLHARYRFHRNRQYNTRFEITMPSLAYAEFSGASNATVRGFSGNQSFDLRLSGASKADVEVQATRADLRLSGASNLDLRGTFQRLEADASGASRLEAFNAPADEADVEASGASSIRLNVARSLKAVATGASNVVYRGNPAVDARPSGGSSVRKE